MTKCNLKKQRELECVLVLMKKIGCDTRQKENILIPSESPDFLMKSRNGIVGIEVTECHPEITKGKNAKNKRAAKQRTCEICKFVAERQDSMGHVVNYRIGFNLVLLFELQKPNFKKSEIEFIRDKIIEELHARVKNGDYLKSDDDLQKLHGEWAKKEYYYTRDLEIDDPLEKSIVSFSYPARPVFPIEYDVVIDAISKKEDKIGLYRKNNPNIKEFWLCVSIPRGVGRTTEGIQKLKIETQYDRVYLISNLECVKIK